MSRTDPAPQPRRNRTARLLALQAVLLAGILGYVLSQGLAGSRETTQPQQPANPELALLQQQPTIGGTGTRYDVIVDFECPYCNQFLSTPGYADILQAAKDGQAQLNVTAAALLNERSAIKGSVYNCVAELAGPTAALQILPDLKTPGGDNYQWYDTARELGAKHVNETQLQACIDEGAAQERANAAFHATGARGVPALFIDGTATPWTQVAGN